MAALMQSLNLSNSLEDSDADWEVLDPRFDASQTQIPSSSNNDTPARQNYVREASDADTDDDSGVHGELVPRTKPGGYDSRIEQILYENPSLPILITDAGKSSESGGRYIVYTIRTGVSPPAYYSR